MLPLDFLDFSFQFSYMCFGFLDLGDNGALTFMIFLKLSLKISLFRLPLLLHISFNLILKLLKFFLGISFYYLLPVLILFFYGLLFHVDFLLFFVVFLLELLFQLLFLLLLLLIEELSLLSQGVANILLHLPFTVL